MEGNTQKVESYDQKQERYGEELKELLKTDPRLQGMLEGMAQTIENHVEDRYKTTEELTLSAAKEAVRTYQEKRARAGLEPVRLNRNAVETVRREAHFTIRDRVDELHRDNEEGYWISRRTAEMQEVKDQLRSIAVNELVVDDMRPFMEGSNLAASIAMEDTLTRMNKEQSLRSPGNGPANPMEISKAADLIIEGNRYEIDRMKADLDRGLRQGERVGKLAEWAVTDEEARATILASLRDEFKIDGLSTNPRRDQDMGTRPGTKETMRHLAMRYVGPEGAEPGGQPFTIPEAEAAASVVVSNNPELVEQAANEGQIEAIESRERDWEDALEYNSEHIEGLPEGWIKVNDYLYTGERGYTIMSLEEPTQYEYRASDGYSRWDGDEWSPAAKGEDPVQQIKDRLEQAERGKVNALVQATHAPEASEPAQDMQARPQMAQDRPRNPRMEISR